MAGTSGPRDLGRESAVSILALSPPRLTLPGPELGKRQGAAETCTLRRNDEERCSLAEQERLAMARYCPPSGKRHRKHGPQQGQDRQCLCLWGCRGNKAACSRVSGEDAWGAVTGHLAPRPELLPCPAVVDEWTLGVSRGPDPHPHPLPLLKCAGENQLNSFK